MKTRRFGVAVMVALMMVPVSAMAQGKAESKDQDIVFKDADKLSAELGSAMGGQLDGKKGPVRSQLIKPRLSFIREMLKTVEKM